MAMSKKLKPSIGIVCEGTKTENQYFFGLIESEKFDGNIYKIIPKREDDEIIQRANGKRPKRQLKGAILTPYHELIEVDTTDYERYKSQPLRYVREAFLLKEEYGCDNVWAVFDRDGHASHQEAFKYADDNGVNIAFCSRSFEQWILLHFEKSNRIFSKVECKVKKQPNKCNSQKPCIGDECLCGYIRRYHIPNYSKSDNKLYDDTKHCLLQAIDNAAWLRCNMKTTDKVYELDTYCNLDNLLREMFELGDKFIPHIKWFEIGQEYITHNKLAILVSNSNIVIINTSSKTVIIQAGSITTSNEYMANEATLNQHTVLEPNVSVEMPLNPKNGNVNIKIDNIIYKCDYLT